MQPSPRRRRQPAPGAGQSGRRQRRPARAPAAAPPQGQHVGAAGGGGLHPAARRVLCKPRRERGRTVALRRGRQLQGVPAIGVGPAPRPRREGGRGHGPSARGGAGAAGRNPRASSSPPNQTRTARSNGRNPGRTQHIFLTDGASPGVRIMINAIIRDKVTRGARANPSRAACQQRTVLQAPRAVLRAPPRALAPE